MTPDEIATVRRLGVDWYQGFIAITNETVLLTIYAVLVVQAAFVLLTRERRRVRAYQLSMTAIFLMFTIALVLWTLDLASFIIEPKLGMIQHPDEALSDRVDSAFDIILNIVSAQDALYGYMSLLGDAIIIHRVWMLKAYFRPWIFILPCALLLGSAVATIMLTYCVGVDGSEIVLGAFENPAFCHNVQQVTYIMPMCTTAVATILIGITAWKHQRKINPLHSQSTASSKGKTRRTQVEKILILLVESGFFYFIFFLIQVIGDIPVVVDMINSNTTMTILIKMFDYCSSVLVGAYPTVILLLAHSKRGVVDEAASMATGTMSTLRAAQMTIGGTSMASGTTFPVGLGSRRDDIEMLDSHGKTESHGKGSTY